ncbi:hypothetical protein KFK09_013401 [Dendrobium nobile]|uniref:Uncharacterized protein n=1 Tax=Dendrobium nobile TaxID=94219 RepID=A0A8T3BCZ2_DENNO|nr:hypothetical protein KFK09_013401 [Dendrobium nobile]
MQQRIRAGEPRIQAGEVDEQLNPIESSRRRTANVRSSRADAEAARKKKLGRRI